MTRPPPPVIFGEFADYGELQGLYRRRAEAINLSRQAIDQLGNFPPGYASTLLAPHPQKRLGHETFAKMAPALGLKLVAIVDTASMAEIERRISSGQINKRNARNASHAAAVGFQLSRRFLRRIAKKGGHNSRRYMSRRRARKLARKAGRIGNAKRWAKPTVVEV